MSTTQSVQNTRRIGWVDIYKGFAIILMVVGHSTGLYNKYIYQFHMAAFLVVSGYTSNFTKRSFIETLYSKIKTLLIPFFTVFALFAIFLKLIYDFGFYGYLFSSEFPYNFLLSTVECLFRDGSNYIYWMGASWFIIVLFAVFILIKGIQLIFKDIRSIALCSFAFFLFGYALISFLKVPHVSLFYFDLIFIAQFYFVIGMILRQTKLLERFFEKTSSLFAGLFATYAILYYFANINPTRVDYPSRSFGFFITDAISAVNGSIFLCFVAILISKIPFEPVNNLLKFLGRNTLGILYFHFAAFKISFFVLYLLGAVPFSYLQNFTPTSEISLVYWPFIVATSIAASICAWKLFALVKPLGYLLGENNGKDSIGAFLVSKLTVGWNKTKIFVQTAIYRLQVRLSLLNILVMATCLISLLPLYGTGPSVNDELQYRLIRMDGFGNLLLYLLRAELKAGRPLRILCGFNHTLTFLTTNDYINSVIHIILVFICLMCFWHFIHKLTHHATFSAFATVSAAVFLPINFEHSAPIAFTGLLCLPFIYLMFSLSLYLSYLDCKKKTYLYSSMLLFVASLLSYEFMLTFVLLYPLIAISRKFTIKKALTYSVLPIGLAFIYLVGMFFVQKIYAGNGYAGAEIGFVSLSSSFEIIKNLFISALPGFYLFSSVYRAHIPYYIDKIEFSDILHLSFVIIFILLFVYAIYSSKNRTKLATQQISFRYTLFAGLLYMIVPSLPNSIAAMYQGIVGPQGFLGLPVTFFLYFAAILAICSLIWMLLQHLKPKTIALCLSMVLLLCVPQQFQNLEFSHVHNSNLERVLQIEAVLKSQTIVAFDDQKLAAADFYAGQNSLSFHDNYWTQYANQHAGVNVTLKNTWDTNNTAALIAFYENRLFVIQEDDHLIVLSPTPLPPVYKESITLDDGNIYSIVALDYVEDTGFYKYAMANFGPFPEFIGVTHGQHGDGWITQQFETVREIGSSGTITIHGYYPNPPTGRETGTVFVADTEYPFEVSEGEFLVICKAPANSIQLITIVSDFIFDGGEDERELCFVVTDITTN